jgi:fructokinase
MASDLRIGVDVGGTKIEAAVLNAGGDIVERQRISAPNTYEATLDALAAIVAEMESRVGARCTLGFGIPGTISPATGLVKNAHNSPFNGYPLDRDLEQKLGRPLRMMNDANCFALSEAVDGNASSASVVFGVIVGTGCGGGVIIEGKPLTGVNAIGGEWGHNPLPWPHLDELPGHLCTCGKNGCIETFLSGTGFAAHHNALFGTKLLAHEIAERATKGDLDAEKSLTRYEDRLARALSSVINLLDPDIIVLGGGMSNVERLYVNVPRLWDAWVFSDRVVTKLVPPRFGDSSGVRGAAWLWPVGSEP